MTRKDYVALAKELHIDYTRLSILSTPQPYINGFMEAVYTVCDALQRDNSRFDKQKFIDAVICGSKAVKKGV